MASINHEKKSIFIHNPKTAGKYIWKNLEQHYDFKHYLPKRPDHMNFCGVENSKFAPYNKKYGVIQYAITSDDLNKMMGLDAQKWNDYKKFCVVRNPYERLVSGWNFLNKIARRNISFEEFIFTPENSVSDYEYCHTFMPQYQQMIDMDNNYRIDHLLKFENLEQDFRSSLEMMGFRKEDIIHNTKKINSFHHDDFSSYITSQDILDRVNEICAEDLQHFHYKKYDTIEQLREDFPIVKQSVEKRAEPPRTIIPQLSKNNNQTKSILQRRLNRV
jgi:hypothetical protein